MALRKSKTALANDLGFGTTATVNNQRMVNSDGSVNIRRTGLPFFRSADTYNYLIMMSWKRFCLMILICYLIINTLFAYIYLWAGIENLQGAQGLNTFEHFFDAFFFSAQTISTVGYGHISPKGILTSSIAAFESMLGLLAFALATGLLYGRFSRPSAKIRYSKNILVAPYQDGKALMFRLTNYRSTKLVELEIQFLMSMNVHENGKPIRKFYSLALERSTISLLTLSWTLVHPVNEDSPIFNMTEKDLADNSVEFLVMLKAFDDTFSQTVHSRTAFNSTQVIWNAKFKPAFQADENGVLVIDVSKIGDYDMV